MDLLAVGTLTFATRSMSTSPSERENGAVETTTTTTTTNSDPQGCLVGYQQCGGWDEVNKMNYSGPTCCHAGFICVKVGKFFSQEASIDPDPDPHAIKEKDGPFMPYEPSKELQEPSNATELTFYVYRASSDEGDKYLDNINVGNLAGTLWYIHNEVVFERPRKFNISKLIRIHTKATQPLIDLGMNFGARFAYDSAQCAGPWSCDLNYQKFGYFVGCNNLGMFPFPRYDTSYPDAVCSELLASYHLKRRELVCGIQFYTAWWVCGQYVLDACMRRYITGAVGQACINEAELTMDSATGTFIPTFFSDMTTTGFGSPSPSSHYFVPGIAALKLAFSHNYFVHRPADLLSGARMTTRATRATAMPGTNVQVMVIHTTIWVMVGISTAFPQLSLLMTQWMMMSVAAG
eukprot:s332_g19.t1